MLRLVLLAQALVYVGTGIWSVVSRPTFERVTGPKTDYWLVRMVGLLAIVIGATLWIARYRTPIDGATMVLAMGSAAAFAAIDLRYAIRRRISRVYLLDAALEIALLVGLGVGWYRG